MQPTFWAGKGRGKVHSTRLAFGKLGSILACQEEVFSSEVKKKLFFYHYHCAKPYV